MVENLRAHAPWQSAEAAKGVELSFEFFPPKTPELEQSLWHNIKELEPLGPRFVSVTYGAGGTTRERTHALVKRIQDETMLKAAAHLTCVGASKTDIDVIADQYWESGIRHIVALRGDPPQGQSTYQPHPQGYAYANDLVSGLLKRHPFEISVAAYPETHPEAPSAEADIEHLKRKVDAGATRTITQYFFDVNHYYDFMNKVEKSGITIDITPGILPVGNYKQMVKFSAMCGTSVPDWVHGLFVGLEDHPDKQLPVAVYIAAEQCKLLIEAGAKRLHFYTLNRADLTIAICRLLGVH